MHAITLCDGSVEYVDDEELETVSEWLANYVRSTRTMTRATEVQMIIMNKGMERGLVALVTELYERMASVEANLRDAAVIQLQMATQLEKIVDGTGNIRKEVERLRRSHHGEADDDLPPTAT